MKFAIGHVVMPSIEYGGDVLITLSNKSCKKMIIFDWLITIIGQVYGYLISFSLYIMHIPCLLMGVGEFFLNACFI
jgi:hypothetical protein